MQNLEESESVYQYTGSLKVVLDTKWRNTLYLTEVTNSVKNT